MTRAAGPSSAGSFEFGWLLRPGRGVGSEVEEGSPRAAQTWGWAGLLTLSPAYLPVSLGFFDDIPDPS